MMKLKVFLFVLSVASFLPSYSFASDGNFWHRQCNSGDSSGKLVCAAFARGFDSGKNAQAGLSRTEPVFCLPEGVTIEQIVDVFAAYLSRHPQNRHKDGGILMALAIANAFPCSK